MYKWIFSIVFVWLLLSSAAHADPYLPAGYVQTSDGWYYALLYRGYDGKNKKWLSHNAQKIVGIDPGTFHLLSGRDSDKGADIHADGSGPKYAADKFHVYISGHVIPGADPVTFFFVGNGYTLDANHVYYRGSSINGADPKSFRAANAGNGVFTAEDKNYYFWNDRRWTQGIYKKSECHKVDGQVLACKRYIVSDGIQYPEIDPASFHSLGEFQSDACRRQVPKEIPAHGIVYQDKHGVYVIGYQDVIMKFNFGADRIFENLDNALENRLCSSGATYIRHLRLRTYKPVIYFYPPKEQETFVKLLYQGQITSSFPEYDNNIHGWRVTAYPDGHLVNLADKAEYSYLFWEGPSDKETASDFTEGFVVTGKDTASFLQKILKEFGLTPREYNEFIVYWMPKMKDNKYNFIHFAGKEYEDMARLDIQPKPDSLLRVFMVYKPIDSKIEVASQEIKPFIRKGFTVVEWGGTELK